MHIIYNKLKGICIAKFFSSIFSDIQCQYNIGYGCDFDFTYGQICGNGFGYSLGWGNGDGCCNGEINEENLVFTEK